VASGFYPFCEGPKDFSGSCISVSFEDIQRNIRQATWQERIFGDTGLEIPTLAKFWLTSRVDRAKWCMWNGKPAKGLRYLQSVQARLTPRRTREAQALTR
jgi:hypothetical protein